MAFNYSVTKDSVNVGTDILFEGTDYIAFPMMLTSDSTGTLGAGMPVTINLKEMSASTSFSEGFSGILMHDVTINEGQTKVLATIIVFGFVDLEKVLDETAANRLRSAPTSSDSMVRVCNRSR